MASNAAWIEVSHGEEAWRFDADFLRSTWTCIWDRGCAGIEETAAVEAQLGCCSVGAQMLDDDEAMLISALGATLSPERAQYASNIADGGVLSDDRRNTRLVDGACIFLNRPGFSGGAGCALHAEATASEESPIDWKPSVCWQLPLKVERSSGSDTSEVVTLRRWQRSDWGTDGETMAYCCTERENAHADAYVGETPVYVSLRPELDALLGPALAASLVDRLTEESEPG